MYWQKRFDRENQIKKSKKKFYQLEKSTKIMDIEEFIKS